jgi:hypothetical protein
MSETYEDNFKARDRKHQYKKRMKSMKEKNINGSIHVFDRLWRKGTRKGANLAGLQTSREEEEESSASTTIEGNIPSPTDYSLQRRRSRLSMESVDRPKSPPPVVAGGEETQFGSTYDSGLFGLSGWWRTLRRAHRNAVRAQNLERVVINSRRYQRRQSQYYESPFANETRAMEELEQMERERRLQEAAAKKRRELMSTSRGQGALWWGPFERWRFRDRTVY